MKKLLIKELFQNLGAKVRLLFKMKSFVVEYSLFIVIDLDIFKKNLTLYLSNVILFDF